MDETTQAPQTPTQQVPVQQVSPQQETLNASPDQQQSPQRKGSLKKFLNISTWIILFAFLPFTVLVLLSQDSVPGDLFYPVKRGLENVVLAAASVNPATRVAFRTNLTETRFKEAQSLVLSKSNTSGLSSFIDEVQGTQLEVTNLSSDTERKTAEEKLISKIEEYQNGLSILQAKTEQNIPLTPTSIPPSPTPTAISSPTPRIISNQSFPQPSSTPIPTITIAPTVASNTQAAPSESTQVLEQKKIAETIRETKGQLDKITKDLEENRSENRQKPEKRNENEKLKKQESDKENTRDEKGKDGEENSSH